MPVLANNTSSGNIHSSKGNQMKKSHSSSTLMTSCHTSQHACAKSINQTKAILNKCPHVTLIGNVYSEDLDPRHRLIYQQNKLRLIEKQLSDTNGDNCEQMDEKSNLGLNKSEENGIVALSLGIDSFNNINLNDHLKCDDCDRFKNLWLCLRDDCMYVGCGQDENSNKHSNIHSMKTYHPLSMNLTTKCVWCDICNQKINLEQNDPPFYFKSYMDNDGINSPLSKSPKLAIQGDKDDEKYCDDYEFISYLNQEVGTQSLMSKSANGDIQNGDDMDDDEDEETFAKKLDSIKNGQLGLVNLYNTCYMNAALQALSNCFAFTSFFLECSQYVYSRIQIQSKDLARPNSFNILMNNQTLSPISVNYLKLMNSLWQLSVNPKTKAKSFGSLDPSDLVNTIKLVYPMFRGHMQHDSQEFLICIMDQLHEELKRPVLLSELNHKSRPCEKCNGYDVDQEENQEEQQQQRNEQSDQEPEETDEDKEDDLTVVQSNNKNDNLRSNSNRSSNNNKDIDSGFFSLNTNNRNSIASSSSNRVYNTSSSVSSKANSNNSGDESIDSFETCGENNYDDQISHGATSSDLSDKLHYSDADESLPSPLTLNNTINSSKFFNAQHKSFSKTSEHKRKSKCKKNSKANKEESKELEKPIYTSIVTELFEGKIISQVQCLECQHLSTTTESFQHLSLPIPSKEYLQALHTKIISNQSYSNNQQQLNESSVPYQSWLSWMMDVMKGYIWTTNIKLTECLTAFFSDDDLKGDNMYSCEKCKKLTNGVKYSKILNLPETLIIQLKRFRHDSMFSTGKLNSYVSFPLDNLNMQPFVHKDCKNEITQYDLCSVICHHGNANGGHYTSYARNALNEEWYEFDDTYCKHTDSVTVQNAQAYVLFYKKKNIKTDTIKEQLRNVLMQKALESNEMSMLRPFYISKQWLHKLKYFGEPGPIDNSDFLCKHNYVQPNLWKSINGLTVSCTTDTWEYLVENFGIKYSKQPTSRDNFTHQDDGDDEEDEDEENCDESTMTGFTNVCNYLIPCKQCQLDNEAMKQRQVYEKAEFIRLREKWNQSQFQQQQLIQTKTYAINSTWFKQWEQFVQFQHCPLKHQVPGPINNFPICIIQQSTNENTSSNNDSSAICKKNSKKSPEKNKAYQLNKNANNYYKISEEMWMFLYGIYGGGPTLVINAPNNSVNNLSNSSTCKLKKSTSDMSSSSSSTLKQQNSKQIVGKVKLNGIKNDNNKINGRMDEDVNEDEVESDKE